MVQTRSKTGTALKKPKRFIEEPPVAKPVIKKPTKKKTVTKKPTTKKRVTKKPPTRKPPKKKPATKKPTIKKSPVKESAVKKSIIKYCVTTKTSAAAIKKALDDAIESGGERPTGRAPAALIYPVTDKEGRKRLKHLVYAMEEIEKYDAKGLDEFLQKEMRENDK